MTDAPQPKAILIRGRLAAAIAVLATGLVAFEAVHEAILHPAKRAPWLVSPFLSMPLWVTVAVNVFFYVCLLWICVSFFRGTRSKERVVVAGWLVGFLLLPMERFSSAVSAARLIEAGAMAVSFFAALAIFINFYANRDSPVTDRN